jgi:hypothetical protein
LRGGAVGGNSYRPYVAGVPYGFCRTGRWARGNSGLLPAVGRGRRPSSWCLSRKGQVAEGRRARQRKGTRSRFLDRDGGACELLVRQGPHHGDVNEPRDIDGGPREGSLPSLTVLRSPSPFAGRGWSRASTDGPGIDSLGDRAERLAERPGLRGVWSAFCTFTTRCYCRFGFDA